MENGSIISEDRSKGVGNEKKEEEPVISLRPGGAGFGSFSFRPGGGFGMGITKPQGNQSVAPQAKPFKSSMLTSEAQLSPQSPLLSDFGGKDSSPSVLTKTLKEEVQLEEEVKPDGFDTNLEKRIYNRLFLLGFQTNHADLPEGLQYVFMELPELQKEPRGSLVKGRATPQPAGNRPPQGRGQGKSFVPSQQKAPTGQQSLPRRAKDRWEPRPSFLKDEKDQLLRQITGILNKITPEKFEKLSTKLCAEMGSIVEQDVYTEAVSLVFSKAVSEPNFSKLYAELCVKLNEQPVALPDQKVTFRRVLLNKCQEEFMSAYLQEDKTLPEDPEDRLIRGDKIRKRKLGNVKFIGELFKSKLLSERIIHECIKILFDTTLKSRGDRETLENHCELLCKLLTTIGKLIDIPKAKHLVDQYFDQILKLSQDDSISSRIRFMFKDVLELRRNSWIPRREETTPKTIGELQADALVKQFQVELELTEQAKASPVVSKTIPQTAVEDKKKDGKKKKKKGKKPKKLTDEELDRRTNLLLQEYLSNGDIKEAEQCIKDLGAPTYHPKIIEHGIILTLEQHDKERELMSKLFSGLFPDVLNPEDFSTGFRNLVENIDDLEIDIPNASSMVGRFLGRAVLDNCVSLSLVEKEIKQEQVRESAMRVINGTK